MASRAVRRPDPEPMQTDDARTVLVGTTAWLLGLVVLLVLRVAGVGQVRSWWIVMCLCGAALGLLGLRWVRRRAAAGG